MKLSLRPYQEAAINETMSWFEKNNGNPLIVLPTGCHAKGTEVLMFDGSVKLVEDVIVGDALMGPDSKPRIVLQLARGREELYRITPNRGEAFVVNKSHILSLKTTNEGKKYPCNTTTGTVENITVGEWENKSKYWKHLRKLYYTGVDFCNEQVLPVDPYVLGALIGDGSIITGVAFTNTDPVVLAEVHAKITATGLRCRSQEKNGCKTLHFVGEGKKKKNPYFKLLEDIGVAGCKSGTKFIPVQYKTASRQDRFELLAGLIDTDGSCDQRGNGYDFVSKSKALASDVVFLAKSLGLQATTRGCEKFCQTGNGGVYWRVHISGDIGLIPVRVERKRAAGRKQKKNHLVTGFSAESIGAGDFYGFSITGDHLYLTADFMVHHNTGKSLVIARLCEIAMAYRGVNAIVTTHVKELVSQNFAELIGMWPDAPAGIYSASLGRRDLGKRITFASIQSVYKRWDKIPIPDLVIIDEAHLVSRNGEAMYGKFISALKMRNPHLRVIGLTATPFRMDSGRLDEGDGKIFDGISFEYSIKQAIDEGFLTPLVSKDTRMHFDLAKVGTRGGEFIPGDLQRAVDTNDNNVAAVEETIALGQDRKSWLFFCSGIEHAQHICQLVRERGYSCEAISSESEAAHRDRAIADFKAGRLRALASMNILTTGFNAPSVDLIAMLRPTKSVSLYIQMAGRGTRLFPGKQNCLVLDFAGNVTTHGPIDTVNVKEPGAGGGEAPYKVCPTCASILHAAALVCKDCGHQFPKPELKITATASVASIMSSHEGSEWVDIESVSYGRHEKEGGHPSLRVTFYERGKLDKGYSEWVCLEHPDGSFAKRKAGTWWVARGGALPVPKTVTEAKSRERELQCPSQILVKRDGKYWSVLAHRSQGALPNVLAGSQAPRLQPELKEARWA